MCLRQLPYRDKYPLGTDNNRLNWRLPNVYLDILPFPSVIYISLYIYMYIYIYVWQISMNLQRAQFVIWFRSNDDRLHETGIDIHTEDRIWTLPGKLWANCQVQKGSQMPITNQPKGSIMLGHIKPSYSCYLSQELIIKASTYTFQRYWSEFS